MNKVLIVAVLLFLISCEEAKQVETQTTGREKVIVEIEENKDFEKIKKNEKSILPANVTFGAIYIGVKEESGSIKITSNGDNVEPEILRKLDGNVGAFIETDVDGDGFNEFYIVSNTGDLLAFSSYRNLSFGEINIFKKPNSFYTNSNKFKFWELKNKKLSLAFEDTEGKLNTVRYKLEQGEASYQLIAE